jgi:hypothetical protein
MNEGLWKFPSRGGIMLHYMPLGQFDYDLCTPQFISCDVLILGLVSALITV